MSAVTVAWKANQGTQAVAGAMRVIARCFRDVSTGANGWMKRERKMPDRRPLTPAEVLRIRQLWDTKRYSARAIAQVYGCAAETVARIGRRETWAWLTEQSSADTPSARGPGSGPVLQTPDEAQASLDRLMEELTKEDEDSGTPKGK